MARLLPEPEWLSAGEDVELRSDDAGYEGAWFAVTIIKLCYKKKGPNAKVVNQVAVRYRDFLVSDEPGSAQLVEFTRKDYLRPLPPVLQQFHRWKVRDAVEALFNDAWWIGYIKECNEQQDKYRVYFGQGQQELDLPSSHIRIRQDYVRPTPPDLEWNWTRSRPMQDPPVWAIPVYEAPYDDETESDDSWDAWVETQTQKRKKRKVVNKSASAKTRAPLRIVLIPPVINEVENAEGEVMDTNIVPSKPSDQTIVCVTPSSYPPVGDSLHYYSNMSPSSDSHAARCSSSSSSEDIADECENSNISTGNDLGETLFPQLKGRVKDDREDELAYTKLLERFRDSSKGTIDSRRHELLEGIQEELQLPREFCKRAFCSVFGSF